MIKDITKVAELHKITSITYTHPHNGIYGVLMSSLK